MLPIGARLGRLHPDQALRACYLSTVTSAIAETLAVLLLVAIEAFPTLEKLAVLGPPRQPEHPERDCESRLRSINASTIRLAMELAQAA